MRILLDTHIFYWALYNRGRLPKGALKTIESAEAVFVSAASIWETAIKVELGKMIGEPDILAKYIAESGFEELPVWSRHAKLVSELPRYHKDPFDRILIAQALAEPLHLLTADAHLKQYSELVLCF